MEMINKERVLQEFLELIRIPCPTRNERAVGDWLTGHLTALGGTVHEDKAGEALGGNCGNLVADFPGTAPGATEGEAAPGLPRCIPTSGRTASTEGAAPAPGPVAATAAARPEPSVF